MENLVDQRKRVSMADGSLEELEVRLGQVADELIARSRAADPLAVELFNRGAVLHRAAFVLKSVISDDVVDLRTEGQPATNRS